jgi:hypothetical protein
MRAQDHDDVYSAIVLGSVRSPGVVTLSGHDRNEDWDIKAAKGQTGASSSLNGRPVGQFQATFYLASDEPDESGANDFTRWDDFQRLIESTTSGPKPTALTIYHPDLARNGFTEVTNGGVGGMKHDQKGGATVVVKFLEYKPPKPKPAAKATAKPAAAVRHGVGVEGEFGAPPPKPDPNADAKRELAELVAKAREP